MRRYQSIPSSNRFLSFAWLNRTCIANNHELSCNLASQEMRGNTMSAVTNYEPNDVTSVGPSFIASEEATLLVSARAGDSAAFECLVCRTGTLSFVLPKGFFAIEKMRRTPFRRHFSMLSAT